MITLTLDAIPDTVAAHLASTLVGHVLWANAQIPLPIPQLAKMQNGTNKKLVRMRAELLDSYDTLISHLATTFTALATAFAKSRPGLSKAELAIIIGPSPTTARSRVLLVLDGLETRVWGAREDEEAESEGDDEDEEEDESAEEPTSDDDASDPGNDDPDDSHPDPDSPPPSSDSDSDSEEETTQELARQTLRTADRLFSRALVDAECAGQGLTPPGKPPSPSQTHILLRAPRGFLHPAWIPKQNFILKDRGMVVRVKVKEGEGVVRDEEEEEDMIWWVWDGKIVGFDGW